MWNAGLEEAQAGIKIAGRAINIRFADGITQKVESEEELKSLLMRVKEESKKALLKLNIQKTNTMTSASIISWHIEGDKVKVVTDFLFLDSKSLQMVTAAMKLKDTCYLEGKLWETYRSMRPVWHFATPCTI